MKFAMTAPREKSVLGYEYDFGDTWHHVIMGEKIFAGMASQAVRCSNTRAPKSRRGA